jgi:DNA-binding MarR family transcriptional regulator
MTVLNRNKLVSKRNTIKPLVEKYNQQVPLRMRQFNKIMARVETNKVALFRAQHKELDITFNCMSILYKLLEGNGKITQKKLAKKLPVTKQAVAAALKVLLKKGLINKVSDARDRRILQLEITEKGVHILDRSLESRIDFDTQLLKYMNKNKVKSLISDVGQLNTLYVKEIERLKKVKLISGT